MKCFVCGHSQMTRPKEPTLKKCQVCKAFSSNSSSIHISEEATKDGVTRFSVDYLSTNEQVMPRPGQLAKFDGSLLVNITALGCKVSLMVDGTGLVKTAVYTSKIGSNLGGDVQQTPRTYSATLGGQSNIADVEEVHWVLEKPVV